MSEFTALRRRAQERRDKAIVLAKSEYAATLAAIAALEQDLLGKESSRHKSISASIESIIPQDRPFTTVDIQAGLEALDPGRVWRKRSIDSHIFRLREKGLLLRVKRSKNTLPAIYIRAGATMPKSPFQNMSLIEVMRSLLAVKSMRASEITVALIEKGYETTMNREGNKTRNKTSQIKASTLTWLSVFR